MSLDAELRAVLRDVVREVVREEMGPRRTKLEEELLTYEQAHERFKVSSRTLSRWVKSGELRAFGKGKLRRVRAEDVVRRLVGEPIKASDTKSKVTSILATLPGRR